MNIHECCVCSVCSTMLSTGERVSFSVGLSDFQAAVAAVLMLHVDSQSYCVFMCTHFDPFHREYPLPIPTKRAQIVDSVCFSSCRIATIFSAFCCSTVIIIPSAVRKSGRILCSVLLCRCVYAATHLACVHEHMTIEAQWQQLATNKNPNCVSWIQISLSCYSFSSYSNCWRCLFIFRSSRWWRSSLSLSRCDFRNNKKMSAWRKINYSSSTDEEAQTMCTYKSISTICKLHVNVSAGVVEKQFQISNALLYSHSARYRFPHADYCGKMWEVKWAHLRQNRMKDVENGDESAGWKKREKYLKAIFHFSWNWNCCLLSSSTVWK